MKEAGRCGRRLFLSRFTSCASFISSSPTFTEAEKSMPNAYWGTSPTCYDNPEKTLRTMIAWGRYAGIMDYNPNSKTVFVPHDEENATK